MGIGRRRLKNIILRLLDGEEYYTNMSPRISKTEIKEVENTLGTLLQIEHTHGAQAGPIAVYPLREDEFTKKAKAFLIQSSASSKAEGEK